MFRSRKSSTISPLQPPASTDPSSKSMQSTPGQGQPQVQSPPPLLPLLPASQYAHGGRGQAQGFPPPQPAYAGDGIGRASSAGTGTGKGTGAAGAERVKEKRRSGFGWLGGKKKDKEKEEREKINVSIYNRDPFFRIVASDLGERGGVCAACHASLRWDPWSRSSGIIYPFIFFFADIYTYTQNRPRPSSFSVDRPSTQSQTRAVPASASQAFPQSPPPQTPLQPQPQPQSQPQHATRPFAQHQRPSPPPGQPLRALSASAEQGAQAYEGQRSHSLDLGHMQQQQEGEYRSSISSGQGKGSPLAPHIPRSASMPMQPPAPGTTPNGGSGSPRRGSSFVNPPQPDTAGPANASQADMDRFRSIVDLIAIQPQKTYVTSPPELEMILARTSGGGQPKQGQPGSATNDWDAVWLQLSGISLCELRCGDVRC